MACQLVLQFKCETIEDFDRLASLEDALDRYLRRSADANLDGHDCGMGEYNMFIHCNRPETGFENLAAFIGEQSPGLPFSAGYRRFTEDIYTPIWPKSLAVFSIS
jgi:hypothetical protein